MQIHKTFGENKIGTRESRLIFADANSGGETSNRASFDYRPNVNDWKNSSLSKYKDHLEEAKNLNLLDDTTFFAKISEAKIKFEKWGKEAQEKAAVADIKSRIETARANREHEKLRDKTVNAVAEGYLSDAAEIRKFVRDEIRDFLKYESDADWKELNANIALEEFLKFENEIITSITGLLKADNYKAIDAAIERDKQRAKKCYQKLRGFFEEPKKKNFLEAVSKMKAVPASERMDVEKLFALATKMESRWNEVDSFIGIVDAKELRDLEQALDAVEMIYGKWHAIEKIDEANQLQKKLFEYESKLANFNSEMRENPPKSLELVPLIETWPELFARRKDRLDKLKKLLAGDKNESTRRLVQSFLDGSAKELEELEKQVAEIGAREQKPSEPEEPKPSPKVKKTNAPELSKGDHGDHGDHGPNVINKFGKTVKKIFTAQGNIKWYSFHDIEQAFHLIKESWKKHTESNSEDKSGPLAHGMMFWREEIRRRVHETDLIAEKGRADERKKGYKNHSYEELVAELVELPAKDKRRAILETLAERGNLRMSDHYLIDAITNNSIDRKDWNYADQNCDYAEIYRKFKKAIDDNFIGEIGYGQQLIDMQTSGQANKESLGEKLGDHSVAGSPAAECGMVAVQIDNASLEGDNVLTGLLKKGFGRGNKFADNGNMLNIKIHTEKGEKTIRENATAGLDALKIVDGYLRGLVSNQTVNGLSKKNEGGYTPYAAFQDVLIPKKDEMPPGSGNFVSKFDVWGWIRDGKITDLGRRQIINFFDSRVAFDDKGNIIHIAKNSGTYGRHSTKYTSIADFRSLGIPVADKMRTTCIKAGGTEIYDNATSRAQGTNQLIGTQQEVTFLIKAACEEIEDGATMMQHGQDSKMKKEGRERLEKGTKALEIMFGNIVNNTEDRDIFLRGEGNPGYNIMRRKKDINDLENYGEIINETADNSGGLEGFLKHYLVDIAHIDRESPSHYNRVMRALANLKDESKILPRNVRDAKSRADQDSLRNQYRDTV